MIIVTEFGKLRYNGVPMELCKSRYIFQDKLDEILGNIEGDNMYINDILVLGKYSF